MGRRREKRREMGRKGKVRNNKNNGRRRVIIEKEGEKK